VKGKVMQDKKFRDEKYYSAPVEGQTILEVIISLAIIVAIMAAMLTQLKTINDSWASQQGGSEALQNGRVLVAHINRNLAKAARIIDVSELDVTSGFIELEDNNGDTYRYEISAGNMVQYGEPGVLYDLAGPVSNFQITCYDDDDLDTPLVIATDGVDGIRFVKVAITVINSTPKGQDKDFWAAAYLRTNASASTGISGCVGWWKLDETTGLTANDSSGNDYHGALIDMSGSEWTDGIIDGGLEFDGINDYVESAIESLNIDNEFTVCAWVWHNAFIINQTERYVTVSPEIAVIRKNSDGRLHFYIETDGTLRHLWNDVLTERQWLHVAGTWDGTTQRLYFNGAEINSQTPGGVLGIPSLNVHLSSSGGSINGLLDDVRIYNRALSAEEIAGLADTLRYNEFTETKAVIDTTSITIYTPSGTSQGDLLIAAVATDGNTSSSLAPPFGEGWTEIDISNYNGEVSLGVWWKLADAVEFSHQFTWSGAERAYGWMMRFTGHNQTVPINASAATGGDSILPTSPAVTTTVNDCLVLRLGAFNEVDITVDDPGLADHAPITMDFSGSFGNYGVSVKNLLEFKHNAFVDGVSGQPTITNNSTSNNDVLFKNGPIVNADILIGPGGDIDKVVNFQNPFTGQHNGTIGNLDAEVELPSSIAEPSLGASIGDVAYSSGTTIINSNIHCDTLTIDGTAIIQIDGDVTILVEGNVLVTDDAKIQLLAGATLDFYGKAQMWFAGNCEVNDNTADPARFRLYHIAEHTVEKRLEFLDFCTAYVQMHGPTSYLPTCRHNSEVYGTFQGWAFRFQEDSRFHVDFGSAGDTEESVSGGAGYVKQPGAGDSGTSTFSLTASEQYCTVTIAIAPDPDAGGGGGGGGGGEILP